MKCLLGYELKKIFSRKITLLALLIAAVFIALISSGLPIGSVSTNSRDNYGNIDAELLQHNKEITKAYTGIVTDEKIDRIIEDYGLTAVMQDIGGQADAQEKKYTVDYERNELTDLVLYNFVDNWGNRISVDTRAPGNELVYAFSEGYDEFIWDYKLVAALAVILAIIGISPVFSSDYAEKTDSLVLTTRFGKNRLIWARVLAAVIFACTAWLLLSGICALLNGSIFGFEGFEKSYIMINIGAGGYVGGLSVGGFSLIYMALALTAVMISAFLTMLLSSKFLPFVTIIASAAFFLGTNEIKPGTSPARALLQLLPAQFIKPDVYLSANRHSPVDINILIAVVAVGVIGLCAFFSFRNYKNHQVG